MSKTINYESGTDTGEAGPESIQPIQNGEDLDQVTLARAEQNLRNRTEVARAEINENRWARDIDRGTMAHVVLSGTLTWNGVGTGTLTTTGGAVWGLWPLYGAGVGRGRDFEGAGSFPSLYASARFDDGNGTDFVLISKKLDFEGGNTITFETVDVPGSGTINVEVNGEATVANPALQPGRTQIVVEYDSTVPHTWGQIDDAIVADAVANALVEVIYAPAPGEFAFDTAQSLEGGLDTVRHLISPAELSAFFAASADNLLREGDVLAIWYDTQQLRRESVEENANNHLIPSASLVNLTREPDKAPNSLVLGRVIDDRFVLSSGYVMQPNVTVGDLSSTLILGAGDASVMPIDTTGYLLITGSAAQDVFDSVDAEIAQLDAHLGLLRLDLNRGITAPPSPGDVAAQGSEHIGIDNPGAFQVIDAATDSAQGALEDLDGEFALLQQGLGTPYVGGSGAGRIANIADDYTQLATVTDGNYGNTVEDRIDAIYDRLRSYTSLQDIFEKSAMSRDGAVNDPDARFPLFLAKDTEGAGFPAGVVFDTGDWSGDVANTEGWSALSTDGRYVIIPGEPGATSGGFTDKVSLYNQRDLSLHATITLSSSPAWTGITSLASDGYSLAVAYDSEIELWDIEQDPPVLDTSWRTSGVYTHSGTPGDRIRDMVMQNGWIYYVGDEADGAGSVPAGVAFAVIDTASPSTIATENGNLNGNGLYIDVWGEFIAIWTDSGFNSLAIGRLQGGTIDANYMTQYDSWTSVHDIAVNARGVAVAGADNSSSDPKVSFRYHDERDQEMYDDDLGIDTPDRICLARTKNEFFVSLSDQSAPVAFVRGYSLHGTTIFETDTVKQPMRAFEFDLGLAGSQFFYEMQTDGVYLTLVRIDINGGDNERLYRYEMGRGSGHWIVNNRGFSTGEYIPQAITPLTTVSAYPDT